MGISAGWAGRSTLALAAVDVGSDARTEAAAFLARLLISRLLFRFAGAFTLRQRMLNFVQNIQYYMMFEVMEPTWHVLEKNLKLVSLGQEGLGEGPLVLHGDLSKMRL